MTGAQRSSDPIGLVFMKPSGSNHWREKIPGVLRQIHPLILILPIPRNVLIFVLRFRNLSHPGHSPVIVPRVPEHVGMDWAFRQNYSFG